VDENIDFIDKHFYLQGDILLYQAHQARDESDMGKWLLIRLNLENGRPIDRIPHSIMGYLQGEDGKWMMILAPAPDGNGKPTFSNCPGLNPGQFRHVGASRQPNFDQATKTLVNGYFYRFGDILVRATLTESAYLSAPAWSLFIINPEDGYSMDSEPGRLLFYSLGHDGHWYEVIDLGKGNTPSEKMGQRVNIDITKLEFVAENREGYLEDRNFGSIMRGMGW
jgi:hypothetical protein